MRVVYSPHYTIDLGPSHLFPMGKYRGVYERLLRDGIITPQDVMAPGPASEEALRRVHSANYVGRFLAGELTAADQRRLGFDWSPALCRRALHATGGTLLALRAALEDGIAANLAGGS